MPVMTWAAPRTLHGDVLSQDTLPIFLAIYLRLLFGSLTKFGKYYSSITVPVSVAVPLPTCYTS